MGELCNTAIQRLGGRQKLQHTDSNDRLRVCSMTHSPDMVLVDLIVHDKHRDGPDHHLLGAPVQARPLQHLQQCDNAKGALDGSLAHI